MQELEEAERYSIAALFTLALHSAAAQADGGDDTWGEPIDGAAPIEFSSEEPDAFWGRDLAARGGLLEAVYFQLNLPSFKWPGLKALPTVAPTADSSAFRSAVHSLIAVLDEDLAASMPAPAQATNGRPASPHARRLSMPDELWDGLMDSSDDEEREKDMLWEQHLEQHQLLRHKGNGGGKAGEGRSLRPESPGVLEAQKALHALSSPRMRNISRQRSDDYAVLVEELKKLSAVDEEESGCGGQESSEPPLPEQDDAIALSSREESGENGEQENGHEESIKVGKIRARKKVSQGPDVSPIALAALWELLQCCVGAGPAAVDAAKVAIESVSDHGGQDSPKFLQRQGPPPRVRWYDARARVALGLVSLWLQVPQRKLATLEVLLGSDKAPTTVRSHPSSSSGASTADRYRYLKVGLAAAGGGALFAVTGGLAAPAIAAGVGSLLGIVPGAGAAAGVVSGFMATQVGVAAVTTTMATAGAATTGSKMAYRTADVKDFGFKEIKETHSRAALTVQAPPQPQQTQQKIQRRDSLQAQSVQGSLGGDDPGHLSFSSGGGGGGGGLQQASSLQRRPSTQSMRSARSGSNASLADTKEASEDEPLASSSSTWSNWFGGKKEKESVEETLLPTPLRASHPAEGVKLSTIVAVSGWISTPEDFVDQWQCVRSHTSDRFSLVWCTSELLALQTALGALLAKGAAGQAARYGFQHLLVGGAGLVTALGPTVVLGAATGLLIENAWTVAGDRADKAGKLLAQVLMSGGAGGRPVTLIAHSMGARLVFSALLEMCRCGARGLVQDVVLLGAPVSPAVDRWRMVRRVVAGRLVNGYSRRDWLLSVMYWHGVAKPAAGLAPVEVDGVENVSLGSVVGGHFEYVELLGEILELLGVPG